MKPNKPIILDASVALKWFRTDEEERAQALLVLDLLHARPELFFVPELFWAEILSVLLKRSETVDINIVDVLKILFDFGLQQVEQGRELLFQAATLAEKFSISGYDAIYLATAELIEGVWLTADRKAFNKTKGYSTILLTNF